MADQFDFSARELMREAQKEVNYRVHVYGKKVASGTMTQREADKRIAMMRKIAEDYGAKATTEENASLLL